MSSPDEEGVKNILINPYYAVVFADYLFSQKPVASEEDWLLLNAALIGDIGVEQWLEELLDVLSLSQAKYDGHDVTNPSISASISVNLRGKHPLTVTRQQWIQANTKLSEELGVHKWLQLLLETLETGGTKAD